MLMRIKLYTMIIKPIKTYLVINKHLICIEILLKTKFIMFASLIIFFTVICESFKYHGQAWKILSQCTTIFIIQEKNSLFYYNFTLLWLINLLYMIRTYQQITTD